MANTDRESSEYLYKVLVVGDIGTGKTSLIKRFVHNIFSTNYVSTIGVDFALKLLNWDQHTLVRLQLWDIAGQERFGNMTRVYYKDAVGAFIVFDMSRVSTFEAVAKWKRDIDSKVCLSDENSSPLPIVLIGNKCDLIKERGIKAEMMDKYCEENGFVGWFETSAKDNVGIDQAAKCLVAEMLKNNTPDGPGDKIPKEDIIVVGQEEKKVVKKDKENNCSC